MRKSIGKVIIWCLLGVLTVVCSVYAELPLEAVPERSAGEKMGSLNRLARDVVVVERASLGGTVIEAWWGEPVLSPEPATLVVLTGGGLMTVSVRVMRKYRTGRR
ncbi:MAG: hypothetical protein KAT11_07470 [Phycisphaerae bacterium]|nr:hypothetical protein [Phycisphaerae bacterium]